MPARIPKLVALLAIGVGIVGAIMPAIALFDAMFGGTQYPPSARAPAVIALCGHLYLLCCGVVWIGRGREDGIIRLFIRAASYSGYYLGIATLYLAFITVIGFVAILQGGVRSEEAQWLNMVNLGFYLQVAVGLPVAAVLLLRRLR